MGRNLLKILVVDENQTDLKKLNGAIRNVFPKAIVFSALTSKIGIDIAREQDPDIIILDIRISGIDSFKFCRQIKADEHLKSIPVIFLITQKTNRTARVKALKAGAEAFLKKPIDATELTALIRAMAKLKAALKYGFTGLKHDSVEINQQRHEKDQLETLLAEQTRQMKMELEKQQRNKIELENANEKLRKDYNAAQHLTEYLKEEIENRKKSEEVLQESENKYRTLFSKMENGFAIHKIICNDDGVPIDYITLEVNSAYEYYLNVKAENVVGKKVSEILPKGELQKWVEVFGPVALTGKSTRYEMYSPHNQKYFEGNAYSTEKGFFRFLFLI